MKTIKTPPLETGGETNWEEEFEIFTQDYEDVFNQYVCCSGGVKGDVDCACNGILWKEKIKDFIRKTITHTNASVTEQTARQTREEVLRDILSATEPYEGSKWLNNITPENLRKVILSEQPTRKKV